MNNLAKLDLINLSPIADFNLKLDLHINSSAYAIDCLINANNDLSATAIWLSQYTNNSKTSATYKREAEKLLLWLSYEVGLSLSELKVEHIDAYLKFLQNPPDKWCTTRADLRYGKANSNWRPFVGKPSISTINISIRAISSLLNYLVQANYLRFNPLKLIKTKDYLIQEEERKYQVWERMLEEDEWQAVQNALNNMPETNLQEQDNKLRTQFLFAMLYFLGLRINEFVNSSWNAFRYRNGGWWFFIRGKGDKLAHIPVNEQLLSFVKIYRLHLNKNPLPEPEENEQFIISKKTKQALDNRQIYGLVKAIGSEAAKEFNDNPIKQAKLRKLSPHWLRHMFASHQDKHGSSQTTIMLNSRHNSLQTTKIYLHAEDKQRHQEIQKLSIAVNPKLTEPTAKFIPLSVRLNINLKAGYSVCPATSLKALIETIEQHIFNNIEYATKRNSIDMLQEQIIANKKFGKGLNLEYKLTGLSKELLDLLIQNIKSECEIRLLHCSITQN
jgi:site-specific recombinase XerD